ncbi:hypothetical protein ACHAXR_011939 [Thalassiosira sp. AJA248-18]
MLAPQSERLPAGPLLDICLQSRELYGEWVKGVERGAREASIGAPGGQRGGGNNRNRYTGEGAKYLWELTDNDGIVNSFDDGPSPPLEPWETGFHSTGGFLAPAFAGDAVATWSPQPGSGKSYWLDDVQVRELEPRLHPNVIGGWWFPEDASVDARRLTCSLRAACVGAGVQMNFGKEWEVKSLEMSKGTCNGVHLANGKIYNPKSIIVANGSWMRNLLPLPVTPHKGQSFSLRMPSNSPPILSRVLFAQDTYIVPKADGRIIVGATVEPGRYDGDVTPEGMMHCLSEATRLIPGLGELPIEESWAGLRPTTPDKCPILGGTEQWDNVYIAGGYWRNGVLLAPKTGQLIGDLIVNDGDVSALPMEDQALLSAFSWERFTTPGGGKALAANARYAATFYPVHKRSTDGVATSVGTELGFYEGAAAAKGDREKDRKAMFGRNSDEEEEALERAAGLGVGDAQAFSFGTETDDGWMVKGHGSSASAVEEEIDESVVVSMGETMTVDADPDAFTVGVKEEEVNALFEIEEETEVLPLESSKDVSSDDGDLPSIYEKIKANKAKASESIKMGDDPTEERADPGYRIYHVDSVTREKTEVPPFTSPGEFFQMKAEGKLTSEPSEEEATTESAPTDGYTAAYGKGTTAESTAEATRRARMSNRIKTSEIDESKIGAMVMPTGSPSLSAAATAETSPSTDSTATGDLSSVYDKIRSNKALANEDIVMGESGEDERPKLNFTIYHVDSETREVREVPQYTSPGEFLDSIEKEKAAAAGQASVNGDSISASAVTTAGSEEIDSGIIDDGSDEKTYDGYQAIQNANSSPSRDEELRLMKEARMKNRAKASDIMGGSGQAAVNGASIPKMSLPQATNVEKKEEASVVTTAGSETIDSGIIYDESDEKTLDGYQAIQTANSASSRDEELRLMKEARIKNRAKASDIMGGSLNL